MASTVLKRILFDVSKVISERWLPYARQAVAGQHFELSMGEKVHGE